MADEKVNSSGNVSPPDVEAGHQTGLKTLSARHLVFLAIGGCVGTGVFLSTGPALAKFGPASLLIAYVFVGAVAYSVMVSLGELAAYLPQPFSVHATRLVSESAGFSTGWIYFYSWAITYGLELSAAGLVIEYWKKDLNIGVWIAVFFVVITAANYLPARLFGEFEMWFSSIKVITIIGFFIFGICVNTGGVGDTGYIGFRYWSQPGVFAPFLVSGSSGKFVGFWTALLAAAFSFLGSELAAVGAAETVDPGRAIPKAIKCTFWTIFSLFTATVLLIGLNVPYDNPKLQNTETNASASPLVIIAQLAGVQVLPSLLNAVLLTAVLSAANSDVFSASRLLVALAEEGHAPQFFRTTNRLGTPFWAVAFSASFGLLGFLNLSSGGQEAFQWLLSLNTVAGVISWSMISVCHLRFRRALSIQQIPLEELPYIAPLQPWLSWFGLFFTVIISLTSGFTVFLRWNTSDFLTSYISIFLFVALYIGYTLVYRSKLVNLSEVDLRIRRVDI